MVRFHVSDSRFAPGTNFLTDLEKLEEEATEVVDEAAEDTGSFAGKLKTLLGVSDEHHDEHKTNGG